MEATIGINQRIPIEAIELAIKAVLNGSYDNDYAAELARMEYSGENRIKKAVNIISRLSKNNTLMSFLQENQSKVMTALKYPDDKGLICISMVNTAYPFCYDVTTVLGRYFHAQKRWPPHCSHLSCLPHMAPTAHCLMVFIASCQCL